MLIKSSKGRVLGFDIENMPLTYYAPDYPTALITAIGMHFEGEPKSKMHVCMLDPINGTGCEPQQMAQHFLERYEAATLVTGHYFRRHDLPHINAMLFELGFPPLEPKLTSDTKDDLIKWRGLPKNQEYLVHQMDVRAAKRHMTQKDWRDANRFVPEGLTATCERVTSDVMGQLELRNKLIKGGYLATPKMWRS